MYIANLAGCGPISVNGPAPSDPLDSQPSMNDTNPVNIPTSTPSPIADTGRERARTRILRATHSSKWSSPSRKNHSPAKNPAPTGTISAPYPMNPRFWGMAPTEGNRGSACTVECASPTFVPAPNDSPEPVDQAMECMTILGIYPSCSMVTAKSPTAPACRLW